MRWGTLFLVCVGFAMSLVGVRAEIAPSISPVDAADGKGVKTVNLKEGGPCLSLRI